MSAGIRILNGFMLGLVASVLVTFSLAQQLAKRLILKDGSYQLITKYEVQGDRVHYFSAERNDWEDVPKSLVDWAATTNYEKDRAAGSPVPEAVQLDRESALERQAEAAKNPEVAPQLRLPDDGEVVLLDTFKSEPELVELEQNNAEVNRDTKHNVLRAAINPIASAKQAIEIPGAHSKIQAHVGLPSIYVKFAEEENAPAASGKNSGSPGKPPPEAWERFRIVRAQTKQDKRIIGNIKVAVYGKVSQQQDFVPAKFEQLTGGWAKITPSNDLAPGEYALVEMIDKGQLNAGVWDFGINPSAPANGLVVRAQPSKDAPNKSVELQQRKPD